MSQQLYVSYVNLHLPAKVEIYFNSYSTILLDYLLRNPFLKLTLSLIVIKNDYYRFKCTINKSINLKNNYR